MPNSCRSIARPLPKACGEVGFLFGNPLSKCGTNIAVVAWHPFAGGIALASMPAMERSEGSPRHPTPKELPGLLRWLNDGLRRGEDKRLEREFPDVLAPADCERHYVVDCGGRLVAHALAAPRTAVMKGRRLLVGVISLVYCDPDFRNRGYAKRAIRGAEEGLRERGLSLALLWSDLDVFYSALGYQRIGAEWFFAFPSDALLQRQDTPHFLVGPPEPEEWSALETLYARHESRCERNAGDLQRLAAAPGSALRVARRNNVAVGYSACGRGDDFPSIVHEWAGPPDAVVATLTAQARGRESLGVLCPPHQSAHARAFATLGGQRLKNSFAWMKLLDTETFRKSVEFPAESGAVAGEDLLRCAFETTSADRPAPLPLYLWGFDSL